MAFTVLSIARPVPCATLGARSRPRVQVRPRLVTLATPDGKTAIESAVEEAKKACEEGTTGECAAAWDSVEEISAAVSHKKAAGSSDPLEKYCDDNPEADDPECRVYED
eukprot:jgi/Botrbrau1/2492/Bobra.0226s0049.2